MRMIILPRVCSRAASGLARSSLCRGVAADRSLLHLLRTNRGAPPGRLSSEEYGRYVPAADGPAVRRKQTPGVRPHHTAQTEQVDKEARERRRPRAGLDERSDSTAQVCRMRPPPLAPYLRLRTGNLACFRHASTQA